jgi:hemerythrin-like domain-containing protein
MPPIHRSHALRPLSSSHHQLLLVAFQVRNGVQGHVVAGAPSTLDGLAALVSSFADEDLRPHFQAEEQVLLAAWPPQGSSEEPEPARLRSEHAEILRLAATVASSSGPDRQAALDRFATVLESHVRWEERSLFGRIERELSAEGLAEVGSKLAQLPNSAQCRLKSR